MIDIAKSGTHSFATSEAINGNTNHLSKVET